jgi:hypothetical protein
MSPGLRHCLLHDVFRNGGLTGPVGGEPQCVRPDVVYQV